MKCFYHSADIDGVCSAAIVYRKHPHCELIPYNYGQPFPWEDVQREQVFMVDVSLQPFSRMVRLNEECSLTWIDHHKTAIQDYRDSGVTIEGLRREGIGACQLTWEYLYPEVPCPTSVELLAQYDVWNHSNPETLPFQYGLRSLQASRDPFDPDWGPLLHYPNQGLVRTGISQDGAAILRYVEKDNAGKAKATSFTFRLKTEAPYLEGQAPGFIQVLAANFGPTNSKLFDSIWDPHEHHAMMSFYWVPRIQAWRVSLYSDRPDVDVSTVAKSLGGGGHKGAAGFVVRHLSDIGLPG